MFRNSFKAFRGASFRRLRAPAVGMATAGLTWASMSAVAIANDADKAKIENELQTRILEEGKREHFESPAQDKSKIDEVIEQKEDGTSQDVVETTEQPVATSEEPVANSESEDGEETHQGAAFNPETGEINWDCPCLGGMAHGPCGEEFKEAFSCFVFSETEPKGIDCIKKFENMRSCFRRYPEHYKEELYEDDNEVENAPTDNEASLPADEAPVVETTTKPKEASTTPKTTK